MDTDTSEVFWKFILLASCMYYMLYLSPNPNGLTIGCWQSSCSLQPVARWTGRNSPKPHTRPNATSCEWFLSSCTKNGAYKIPVQSGCLVWKAKRLDRTGLLNSNHSWQYKIRTTVHPASANVPGSHPTSPPQWCHIKPYCQWGQFPPPPPLPPCHLQMQSPHHWCLPQHHPPIL